MYLKLIRSSFSGFEPKLQLSSRIYRYHLYCFAPERIGVFCPFLSEFAQYNLDSGLDFVFSQYRRRAFVRTAIFGIAVPNIISVGVFMVVPNLMAIEATANTTDDGIRQRAVATNLSALWSLCLYPGLHLIKSLRVNNRIVRILD